MKSRMLFRLKRRHPRNYPGRECWKLRRGGGGWCDHCISGAHFFTGRIPIPGWIFSSQISLTMVGKVHAIIFKSSHSAFSRAYFRSNSIISSKVVLFLPLTCHKPVNPGGAEQRCL